MRLEGNEGIIYSTRFSLRKIYKLTTGNLWKNKDGWFLDRFIKCYDLESKTFCYYPSAGISCDMDKLPEYAPYFSYNEYYNCTAYEESYSNWECGFHGITCNENGSMQVLRFPTLLCILFFRDYR